MQDLQRSVSLTSFYVHTESEMTAGMGMTSRIPEELEAFIYELHLNVPLSYQTE